MLNYLIIDKIITEGLKEDMPFGDITTSSIINNDSTCSVSIYSKDEGIICGLPVFRRVFALLGDVDVEFYTEDGAHVSNGEEIGKVFGNTRKVLMGERLALNLLQRMSGIATLTSSYAKKISSTSCKVVDTRKTTPLYRHLDKYSVLCGGGSNHRFSLSDSILIKDNHIDAAGSIGNAINLARKNSSFTTKIEVETETRDDVLQALDYKADIIMLDNMSPSLVKEMVLLIEDKAIVECSGNINLDNIIDYALTGVNFISVGALTHSFKVLDISLKNLILND